MPEVNCVSWCCLMPGNTKSPAGLLILEDPFLPTYDEDTSLPSCMVLGMCTYRVTSWAAQQWPAPPQRSPRHHNPSLGSTKRGQSPCLQVLALLLSLWL